MGAIGGLLGLNGGAGGSGFNPTNGVSQEQLNNTYNASNAAMGQQSNLLNALQAQNGLQNQSNVYGQLQNVVSGQGPNPAQAMLNQATAANVANQAALMGGQRGAGANVGLMARQAAQQGGNLQQQAAGQGATMQANQALGALGQAGNMANTMAGNQIGQTNANTAAQQNQLGILQNANTAAQHNQAQLANTTMQGQQGLIGGLLNSAGAAAGMADGGMIPKYADGGSAFGPQSMFANSLSGSQPAQLEGFDTSDSGAAALKKGAGSFGGKKPPAMGTTSTPTQGGNSAGPDLGSLATMFAAQGGNVGGKLKAGGHVPGKPKVPGNSYKNDTVKALLSPGEVVIPNSVMQSKDPVRGAASFVQSVLAKKGRK